MRFRINWVEKVSYYAYVEADTAEAAVTQFKDGEHSTCEPDECGSDVDYDSIAATPDPETPRAFTCKCDGVEEPDVDWCERCQE